jgi:hypothetical protein
MDAAAHAQRLVNCTGYTSPAVHSRLMPMTLVRPGLTRFLLCLKIESVMVASIQDATGAVRMQRRTRIESQHHWGIDE